MHHVEHLDISATPTRIGEAPQETETQICMQKA